MNQSNQQFWDILLIKRAVVNVPVNVPVCLM